MPCLAIHLAVAKKYLEKHQEEDYNDFILGTIAPDINLDNINKYINGVSDDKNSHHFGTNYKSDNIIEYMKNKVDFNKFFASNDINTSFLRAYFLHLLCDYYFFGDYIDDDRLKGLSFTDVVKIGYNDYDLITPMLIKKYDLKVPSQIKSMINGEGVGTLQILDENIIDSFINNMSNINLDEEMKKMLNK